MITLLPLLETWHLHYPAYNAESILELTRLSRPDVIVLGPLPPSALASPSWQATREIVLPLSIVPWAERQGIRLETGMPVSPDPEAEADFRRYAQQYPQFQNLLREVDGHLSPLTDLLPQPLTLSRIWQEVVPCVAAYQGARAAAFDDGPGTDWLQVRVTALLEQIRALPEANVTVLASVEQLPLLQALLPGETLELPQDAPTTEATRQRALLDVAFRGDAADPERLLPLLRELECAEARYHEANLLLAHGHIVEALETLEAAAQGDFSAPYYLPGYLLARLGQVRDLVGERDSARRAYRGVLALDWVPAEALAAAQAGLETPFEGLYSE